MELETKSRQRDAKSGNVEHFTIVLEAFSNHGHDFCGRCGTKGHGHGMKTTRVEAKPGHVDDYTVEYVR